MNIKILGTGCTRCHELAKNIREVIKELSIDATIEEISDINKIISYHVMITPGLVINEKVVISGKVPTKTEIMHYIKNNQ